MIASRVFPSAMPQAVAIGSLAVAFAMKAPNADAGPDSVTENQNGCQRNAGRRPDGRNLLGRYRHRKSELRGAKIDGCHPKHAGERARPQIGGYSAVLTRGDRGASVVHHVLIPPAAGVYTDGICEALGMLAESNSTLNEHINRREFDTRTHGVYAWESVKRWFVDQSYALMRCWDLLSGQVLTETPTTIVSINITVVVGDSADCRIPADF